MIIGAFIRVRVEVIRTLRHLKMGLIAYAQLPAVIVRPWFPFTFTGAGISATMKARGMICK